MMKICEATTFGKSSVTVIGNTISTETFDNVEERNKRFDELVASGVCKVRRSNTKDGNSFTVIYFG